LESSLISLVLKARHRLSRFYICRTTPNPVLKGVPPAPACTEKPGRQKGCLVDYKQRYRRLRLLISKLNKERRKQAQKIDILCNDFISAHRDFIKRLNTINFTANFYEAIVGTTGLSGLLYAAGKLIKDEIPDSKAVFFLLAPPFHADTVLQKDGKMGNRKKSRTGLPLQRENFKLYMTSMGSVESFESNQPITLEKRQLENYFTPELVENICKSNKLCTLDDMFAMGGSGNLIKLNKISAVAVPLHRFGSSLGFILIYRSSENKLTPEELNNVSAVSCGLSRAIQSCQILLNSAARTPTPAGAGDGVGIASAGD